MPYNEQGQWVEDETPYWQTEAAQRGTLASNPAQFGYQALGPNTPSFEQWMASNPSQAGWGDATPEQVYLQQFYQAPPRTGSGFLESLNRASTLGFSDVMKNEWGLSDKQINPLGSMVEQGQGPLIMAALGGGAIAGGAGTLGAGEAATAGLGEGIGADAYFAVAGAPTGMGTGAATTAGEYGLGTGSGLGLEAPTTAPAATAGEYSLASGAGAAPAGLGGGATGYGLSGNAAIPAATAAGGAGAGVAGSTALGRLLGVGQTGQDLLSVGGGLVPGILGYIGQQQQTDALNQLGQQYFQMGAPARSRLESSYAPGWDLFAPGTAESGALQRSADVSAKAANVKYGNPYDAAPQFQVMNDVMQGAALPAIANWRGQNMQAGGMGLNTSGAISGAGAGLAGSQYAPVAGAIGQTFNTPSPYEDLIKKMIGNYKLA